MISLERNEFRGRGPAYEVMAMATCSQLLSALKNGAHDSALSALYAPEVFRKIKIAKMGKI